MPHQTNATNNLTTNNLASAVIVIGASLSVFGFVHYFVGHSNRTTLPYGG
jgi:hypothetical protein